MNWLKNWLYMAHAFVIWIGVIYQIIYVYSHKSATDITVIWMVCLLLGELFALPRALDSPYWAWKLCHLVAFGLLAVLLSGVILYG